MTFEVDERLLREKPRVVLKEVFTRVVDHPHAVPIARILGHYGLALLAVLLPEVGEHRFLLAGLLAFVFGPLAFFTSLKFLEKRACWIPTLTSLPCCSSRV